MEQLTTATLIMSSITALLVVYLLYRSVHSVKKDNSTAVFVDTSVLIDARIVSIAKTGFVPGKLIIPRSVIGELQYMADNADNEKRAKARRGLDVIKELQEIEQITVEILQDGSRADEGVDERLLKLTKERGGYLCTIDYNLNKVAQVENIQVLNVNELAQQIRIVYLPGDTINLPLTQKGQDSHQAVGHLEDGTMVVVEHSSAQIGTTVEVSVIRSLQTAAGRMIFAKRTHDTGSKSPQSKLSKLSKYTKPAQKSTKEKTDTAQSPAPRKTTPNKRFSKTQPQYNDAHKSDSRASQSGSQAASVARKPSSRDRESEILKLVDKQ